MKQVETPYFTLKEIDDGIHAAIAKPGTGAFSNAGFVDLGEELLVFDSFSAPAPARALRKLAEELTGKPVKYLINSHFHGDHTFGNQIFSDATIISTSVTRELHKKRNHIQDNQQEYEEMKAYLKDLQNQIEQENDELNLLALQHQLAEMVCVTEAIPGLIITLPNFIFEDHLTIHGSKRSVELFCFGGGHTPSDAILYIPEDRTAFMGDLLTIGMHLPIFDTYAFIENHEHILKMDIDTYIPGHGDISTKSDFLILNQYLHHLIDTAEKALKDGLSLEQVIKNGVAPEYSHWRAIGGAKRTLTVTYEAAKQRISSVK